MCNDEVSDLHSLAIELLFTPLSHSVRIISTLNLLFNESLITRMEANRICACCIYCSDQWFLGSFFHKLKQDSLAIKHLKSQKQILYGRCGKLERKRIKWLIAGQLIWEFWHKMSQSRVYIANYNGIDLTKLSSNSFEKVEKLCRKVLL